MSIYRFNSDMLPDEAFTPGTPDLLVEGNSCRLLDRRRTPGVVERYFHDSAMFRWRITDFEHKGRHWDLPAEDVVKYQFQRNPKKLSQEKLEGMIAAIQKFQTELKIEAAERNRERTESKIRAARQEARGWLQRRSLFFEDPAKLNLDCRVGPSSLAEDLIRYLGALGMEEIERRTADNIVLNPSSGEWVKGMQIVLAEMGLAGYRGKIPRTQDIFEGLGGKDRRRHYLIHRLAFVRAYFDLLGIHEVVFYRGMSAERPWGEIPRTFLSCTFSLEVAESLSDFERDSTRGHSYLVKSTLPVDRLFMTYLETKAMNDRYKEAEAFVLYDQENRLAW